MAFVKDIYAYHTPIFKRDTHSRDLIRLWMKVWRAHGWEPHILGPDEAKRHPKYKQMLSHIATLPTANHRRYEDACYIRWLAFARHAGVMSDYDVFPQRLFPPREFGKFTDGQPNACGFMVGKPRDFEKIVDAILSYTPRPDDFHCGKPHVSDMVIVQKNRHLFQHTERYACCYGEEGWERYPLVHFANAWLKQRGRMTKVQEILSVL